MTDYCLLTEVKSYLGTDKSTDDAVIAALIPRATAAIDTFCQRHFVARTETRCYDAVRDVRGRTLVLDEDLLAVTTLTNGDGEALASSFYVLEPANHSPKYAIRLKASSGRAWAYTGDPEQAIAVAGRWGFYDGTLPPDDIRHAAVRLTAWYYHQRQAPFETTGFPDLGQVVVPSSLPADIKALLAPYQRGGVVT